METDALSGRTLASPFYIFLYCDDKIEMAVDLEITVRTDAASRLTFFHDEWARESVAWRKRVAIEDPGVHNAEAGKIHRTRAPLLGTGGNFIRQVNCLSRH